MSDRLKALGASDTNIVDVSGLINAPRAPADMVRGPTPNEDVRLRREPGM